MRPTERRRMPDTNSFAAAFSPKLTSRSTVGADAVRHNGELVFEVSCTLSD